MFGRDNKKQELTISNNTILRIIGFGLATVLVVRIFENIVHPLTLIFVSIFLAIALNRSVNWVSKNLKTKSRTTATTIAYISVISVLIGFLALVVPPLTNQTREFVNDVPQTLRDLKEDEGFVGDMIRRYDLEEQVSQFASDWARDFSGVGGQAVSIANRVVSNIISIIVVLVLTFMMLIEGPKWMQAFWKQYPAPKRKHAQKIVAHMNSIVTNYVYGQMVVAAIGAAFAIVALFIATAIFNVDSVNAVALGGIVFLFSLIPMFGATIAAIIVSLFSLFASPALAITMAIYFIVYQQIENASIQPYIQSKGNELTPMLVFIAAIIGVSFGGILGAFVAIPTAGCIKVLIDEYLNNRDDTVEKA
jgi:predicted PurR-regulated permease PerM